MKDLAVLGEPALAPFFLRMSCADLAPEALSVRLGFLTKHYIMDLLMKDLYQKGFNDIYIAVKKKNAKIYVLKSNITSYIDRKYSNDTVCLALALAPSCAELHF